MRIQYDMEIFYTRAQKLTCSQLSTARKQREGGTCGLWWEGFVVKRYVSALTERVKTEELCTESGEGKRR